jgi:hypothetical protein
MEIKTVANHSGLRTRKNVLERILSVAGDVRPGEGLGALILTINLFTLLGTYYLLKTVRESLILAQGGAEVKAYSSAAQAVVLLVVVPLYGWIATYLNRNRLLRWTTPFFALNLLIFYFREPDRRSNRRHLLHLGRNLQRLQRCSALGLRDGSLFPGSVQEGIPVTRSRRIRWSIRRGLDCRDVN